MCVYLELELYCAGRTYGLGSNELHYNGTGMQLHWHGGQSTLLCLLPLESGL